MYHLRKFKSILRRSQLTSSSRDAHKSATGNRKIDKILIANRGEIACRISKTARKLGIRTVAVYSDVDRNSMHVDVVDEAYHIGPAPSSQSYLKQEKIISVAKKAKCQAIHPGYGFLSENTEFAELCQKEGIIFIGPPANAIRDMGIKNTSKAIMTKAGVPVIEGYHGKDQSDDTLLSEARKIGFPLMIKAVRGGGGKGMRIVKDEKQFTEALQSARTESQKAFGDSDVLLEKYIEEPRHVEVQVFADMHGNVVHLFERDCSLQRRHQKVIEEAPAPGVSAELRSELGMAATQAAKAVGYVGAGTVEFIMDRKNNSFHFMEMNTRLQVEHPVTEAITGLDLVEWQLKIAAGEKLPLRQEEINLCGHAFEARIYAENPRNGFLPGAGKLLYLKTPEAAENVRVETGVRENDEVSVHYDPMIAKLVTWGGNRQDALNILRSKLSEYNIAGLDTNIEFIKDICAHPSFQSGDVHTGFIQQHEEELFPKLSVPNEIIAQGTLALILYEEMDALKSSVKTPTPFNPFTIETGLRINHVFCRTFNFRAQDTDIEVDVKYDQPDVYLMRINKIGPWRKVNGSLRKKHDALELKTEIDGVITKVKVTKLNDKLHIYTKNREWQLQVPYPKFIHKLVDNMQNDTCAAVSPMPGLVDKIFVKKGDKVKKGDSLLVINAMKMEHVIKASTDGLIEDILCSSGDTVPKNKLLVKMSDVSI